jgi:hypothetical protein
MRRGFEGNVFINTGSAASPTWLPVDVVDDVTIEDDSEQHGTEHRGQRGNATKARGLLSLKVSFAVESDANAPEVIAALLTAARERDAVADFLLTDSDAAPGVIGFRLLACVVLTDSQPAGGRWLWKFDAMPTRPVGDWLAAEIAPLALYAVPETEAVPLLLESGESLDTETGEPFILEV